MGSSVTAFLCGKQIAFGDRDAVTRILKDRLSEQDGTVLVFDDLSGAIIDLDYRNIAPRSAGRPKLGVQAREVTLLPRHWEWLSRQSGGASSALRRLVDNARAEGLTQRERRDKAYRFMQAACGDMLGYEDALRALYSAQEEIFYALVDRWPDDFGGYIRKLLSTDMNQKGEVSCA